jgi:hypothetical protein
MLDADWEFDESESDLPLQRWRKMDAYQAAVIGHLQLH